MDQSEIDQFYQDFCKASHSHHKCLPGHLDKDAKAQHIGSWIAGVLWACQALVFLEGWLTPQFLHKTATRFVRRVKERQAEKTEV